MRLSAKITGTVGFRAAIVLFLAALLSYANASNMSTKDAAFTLGCLIAGGLALIGGALEMRTDGGGI